MIILFFCPIFNCYNNIPYSNTKITSAQLNLNNNMRMLWEQHSVWTRSAIESIVFDLPSVDVVVNRLLRNPVDFGQALRPFYGENIASNFSNLLRDHLVIAADLVKAAKAGDNKATAAAEKKWYANADQIAVLLGNINPYWSQEVWRNMLHEHLALVKAEAVSLLMKNYETNVSLYDQIERQAFEMADTMTRGIIKQFPNMFI